MNGCRFLEKKFSVPVKNVKDSCFCSNCYCNIDESICLKINGELFCKECFANYKVKSTNVLCGEGFYTPKDKLWEFTDTVNFKTDVEIRCKSQWKRLLKQNGMHDDVKSSPRKVSEFMKDKSKPVQKEEIAKCIWEELRSKGLNDKVLKQTRR